MRRLSDCCNIARAVPTSHVACHYNMMKTHGVFIGKMRSQNIVEPKLNSMCSCIKKFRLGCNKAG